MKDEPQGCLFGLFRLLGITRSGASNATWNAQEVSDEVDEQAWPYRVRDDFLSPAEISFYHVLKVAVGEQYTICPKVGLADIFFVARRQESIGFVNSIARKHVDFLLCDPQSLKPMLGVELDDASHQAARRVERDKLVERVFEVAGLPLVRIPVQPSYAMTEVRAAMFSARTALSGSLVAQPLDLSAPAYPQASSESQAIPSCPKCGVPMVLRTAQRGDRVGQQFYGCPNYPKCRQVVNLVAAQDT